MTADPTTDPAIDEALLDEAREDAATRAELLRTLVRLRAESGLSQRDVADWMGARLRDVEKFESGVTDPRLSFGQRYARVVGARVRVEVIR